MTNVEFNPTTNVEFNEMLKTKYSEIYKACRFTEIEKSLALEFKHEVNKFSQGLVTADKFKYANAYLSGKEGKESIRKTGFKGNKYDFLEKTTGLKPTQIKLYIAISKLENEIIENFKISGKAQTLDNLRAFANAKDDDKETINTTKIGITDKTTKDKPKKLQTESKHIEAKIHEGATKTEAIELIKKLMESYSITAEELI